MRPMHLDPTRHTTPLEPNFVQVRAQTIQCVLAFPGAELAGTSPHPHREPMQIRLREYQASSLPGERRDFGSRRTENSARSAHRCPGDAGDMCHIEPPRTCEGANAPEAGRRRSCWGVAGLRVDVRVPRSGLHGAHRPSRRRSRLRRPLGRWASGTQTASRAEQNSAAANAPAQPAEHGTSQVKQE